MQRILVIFTFSMVVALTGALVPGPLLSYTIVKTLETRKRGFLVGFWVILGHALLEGGLIVAILLGFSLFLKNQTVIRVIGVVGGSFLVYMGISIIVSVARKKVSLNVEEVASGEGNPGRASAARIGNPVLGGVLVSMSNPYWWIWWATVGFGFMLQYRVSFENWPALLSFLTGHEMGDLAWYAAVSTMVSIGRRHINQRVYSLILLLCSAMIIAFGCYLGIAAFLKGAPV
jgi:threonine/homoserine/homoserine lactone efflux protein